MDFTYLTHEDVPRTLYHYTSLDALVSIVQSKRLRASNIRFLNDRTESLRLKESVVEILQKRAASAEDEEIVRVIVDLLGAHPTQSHFVASLSEKCDLLSQWRAYCPSGLGVSIGFPSGVLSEQWIANPTGGRPFFLSAPLQKVRYYAPGHQKKLEEMVERLLALERLEASGPPRQTLNPSVIAVVAPPLKGAFKEEELVYMVEIAMKAISDTEGKPFPGSPFPPGSALASWVLSLAPFVKHDAFEEECEWRKLISKDNRVMPGQKFRPGKSTLIPFVEIMLDAVRLDAECVPRNEYFIDEVVIGPTPTPDLTFEALRSLFDSEGHSEVNIRQSRIPFKDW
jgi:hypothetical protein